MNSGTDDRTEPEPILSGDRGTPEEAGNPRDQVEVITTDVLVIGGGMAGVGAAYELSADLDVVLVEAEATLAYHTTGRSAALFAESYGPRPIRALTAAGRDFITSPPEGLAEFPLLEPLPTLFVTDDPGAPLLEELAETIGDVVDDVRHLSGEDLARTAPMLAPHITHGLVDGGSLALDVAGLHQVFVKGARRRGARIETSAPVTSLRRENDHWVATAGPLTVEAGVIVNAAGAWGDRIAELAGVAPVGLTPLRRTAFVVKRPPELEDTPLPAVVDGGRPETWYVKPEPGLLLCSPADETPSEPCDARPEEIDVALGIDRVNHNTTLGIRHVVRAWAGLRTFAPDRLPVVGFDPDVEGFMWLVGQGGYGIQSSPGMSRLCASLVRGLGVPGDLIALGLDPGEISPSRFADRRG